MFPWPVTMVVKFCVKFIFVCSLSATFGKYSFVILPLFVVSHSLCQVSMLFSSRSLRIVASCWIFIDTYLKPTL